MYCFQIHVSPPFSPAPQGEEVWQRSVCCSCPPYCLHELPMFLLGGSPDCFNFSRLYFTLMVLSLSTETVSHRLPDAPSVGLIVLCQLVVYSSGLRTTGSDRWSTWISLNESFSLLYSTKTWSNKYTQSDHFYALWKVLLNVQTFSSRNRKG